MRSNEVSSGIIFGHHAEISSPKIVILDVERQIRLDELQTARGPSGCARSVGVGEAVEPGPDRERTSSRIFFQMMRVISSPSSSTTGPATLIFLNASAREEANAATGTRGHEQTVFTSLEARLIGTEFSQRAESMDAREKAEAEAASGVVAA